MAAPSSRRLRLYWSGICVLLLLILLQILLLHFAGVFINSKEVRFGPAFFCLYSQDDEPLCDQQERDFYPHSFSWRTIIYAMMPLCFYVPIALVAFALLSLLFSAYGKDRGTLWCSLALQAASCLLILGGIIVFLIRFRSYVSLENMTVWFYLCLGVEAMLILTTVLTWILGRKLTSDWK